VFFILATIYFVVCWTLTRAAVALERRIQAKRAGLRPAKGDARKSVVTEPLAAEP
jgi:polar amino acid transport system permease protein